MPIDISKINDDQKRLLLDKQEGHFMDMKAKEITPAKLTKTICGFANADGGELYVGIDEDSSTKVKTWRGFNTPEDANSHIQTFEDLFPLGTDFDYEFLSHDGSPG